MIHARLLPLFPRALALCCTLFASAALQPATCHAEMFFGAMSPASVVRGSTTRVVLAGSELEQAFDLWTSTPGGKVTAKRVSTSTPAAPTFDVTVAADCPIGLFGIRAATIDGLSNSVIFLVDDLKPVAVAPAQASAADKQSAPMHVTLPAALAGTFRPSSVDRFQFDAATGEELSFECVASRFGKDADPLIRILDARGKLVVEYDNDPGLFFDFRFAHKFREAGSYTVELADARFHGDKQWNYILRIGKFPAARVAVPSAVKLESTASFTFPELPGLAARATATGRVATESFYHDVRRPGDNAGAWIPVQAVDCEVFAEAEPNDIAEKATKVTAPAALCGVLGVANDVDYFEFELKKGDRLAIKAETTGLDSAADVELAMINSDGKEMQRIDDVLLEEASFLTAAPKDGKYWLLVHDVTRGGGSGYTYRVDVRPVAPKLELTADIAELTIPQGEYQSMPLLLTHAEYAGPVKLGLVGAPAGVRIEPAVIEEGKLSTWARVYADAKTPLGLSTIQITATGTISAAGDVPEKTFTAIAKVRPMIDKQLLNVDLIKYSLRVNQRKLPPSMADRIALQVTPPAPFTMDLPETALTLVRFLSIELPIATTRRPEFKSPITFKAIGGQIGEESEIRRQIYVRSIPATPEKLNTQAAFYSRNLPNEQKDRIDISAIGEFEGRRVQLIRSFDMELKAAFDVTAEKPIVLLPGESAKVTLLANRLPPFTGPIKIETIETPGITFPTTITIPEGQASIEVEVKVAADFTPRKVNIRLPGQAQVGKFVEDGRAKNLEVDVKKPEVKKPEPPKPEPKKPDVKPPVKPASAKK